jgi:peroxiredoxin
MPQLVRRAKEGRFMNHWKSLFITRRAFLCMALVSVVLTGIATTNAHGTDELPQITGVELTDLSGQKHTIGGQPAGKLTVLVFLGTQCPVSNSYAPMLKRLYDTHASAGVCLLGVHCDPDVSAQIAQSHAREYELPLPLVLDHDQRLAKACGVKIIPTAIVINAAGHVLYRGRIDNRFVASGLRRPEPTTFDLTTALESALAGQQPNPSTTEPVGCPLPLIRQ